MSDLLTRAEIVKLSRTLGEPPEELLFLAPLGADHLRELRRRIASSLYDAHRGGIERIAKLARLVPSKLGAKLAERFVGPELSARAAGAVDPRRGVDVGSASVDFMADTITRIDPRVVPRFIPYLPVPLVVDVTHEMLRRQEYVISAQFVDYGTEEMIHAVAENIRDDEIGHVLRTAVYVESDLQITRVLATLRDEQVRRLVRVAVAGAAEMQMGLLLVMSRVGDDILWRLGDLLAETDTAALIGMLRTTVRECAVAELLSVLARMNGATRHAVLALASEAWRDLDEGDRAYVKREAADPGHGLPDALDVVHEIWG